MAARFCAIGIGVGSSGQWILGGQHAYIGLDTSGGREEAILDCRIRPRPVVASLPHGRSSRIPLICVTVSEEAPAIGCSAPPCTDESRLGCDAWQNKAVAQRLTHAPAPQRIRPTALRGSFYQLLHSAIRFLGLLKPLEPSMA
jgi:hypothetical protein